MLTRRQTFAGLGAAAVGAVALGAWKSAKAGRQADRRGGPRDARLPNTALETHDGRSVRFYDDLVEGRVVAINMMYVRCDGICPRSTGNLREVQRMLADRAGRDVHMYSITLKPEEDTPEALREYAELHHVGPGWTFLTGAPADIRRLRYQLGFYDLDPRVDGEKASHTGMVRIGNEALNRWTSAGALASPAQILATINHVDPKVTRV